MTGYKVFTHNLCSPIRGGDPVWDGSLPYKLPRVVVDRSEDDCGAGWNFASDAAIALRIAGLWPNGRPSRVFEIDTGRARIETRTAKCRVSTATIVRELPETEISEVVRRMSEAFVGVHADVMATEQMTWRQALSRPDCDVDAVESNLRIALQTRNLDWTIKQYPTARDAWDVKATWDARNAWAAWDARDARDAWAARAAWDAWNAWAAWDAWDVRDAWAARAAWDVRAARAAWNALTLWYAAQMGWVDYAPDYFIVGLRDAYRAGAEIVLPTGRAELGYAMTEDTP